MSSRHPSPEAQRPRLGSDLSESLDVRLVVAGRLSRTAIPVRRDREELAAVVGGARQPRPDDRR
jgi:hypothetical protein